MPDVAEARVADSNMTDAVSVSRRRNRNHENGRVFARLDVARRGEAQGPELAYSASVTTKRLVQIIRAAEEEGISVGAVGTADFAWLAAAGSKAPGNAYVVAAQLDSNGQPQIRLIAGLNGLPIAIRRIRPDSSFRVLIETLRGLCESLKRRTDETPTCVALGDAAFRERIRNAATDAGMELMQPTALLTDVDHSPGLVAAAFAGHGPRFVPPTVIAAGEKRQRRRTWIFTAGTAAMLIGSAVLGTRGLSREIAHVHEARVAIAGQVAQALQKRSRASDVSDVLASLGQLRAASPRWTEVLTGLSEHLPVEAHVTNIRAVGDSLYIDLQGSDAGAAFEAVRQIPGLIGFRAAAPIQRDVSDGTKIVEHFSAAATVSWAALAKSGAGSGGSPQ